MTQLEKGIAQVPYIPKNKRKESIDEIYHQLESLALVDGEVNYLITRLAISLTIKNAGEGQIKYKNCQDTIGVLECAKQEYYRRVLRFLEEMKMGKNPDPYYGLIQRILYEN